MDNNISYDYITEYIRKTISSNDEFLQSLEGFAKENSVPIVQLETAKLIEILVKIIRPKRILEIGTAIGYSSILMAKALNGQTEIDTLERDVDMIQYAKKNINDANMSKVISVIEGDAQETLTKLSGKYDIIFIDAAKGQYLNFFNNCKELLNSQGLIISDNILFKGMIANDELVSKKNKTIVNRMREFLDILCNNKDFDTSIIPIGDGIALSYKRS